MHDQVVYTEDTQEQRQNNGRVYIKYLLSNSHTMTPKIYRELYQLIKTPLEISFEPIIIGMGFNKKSYVADQLKIAYVPLIPQTPMVHGYLGSSLKWTLLGQSGRSMGVKLYSPNPEPLRPSTFILQDRPLSLIQMFGQFKFILLGRPLSYFWTVHFQSSKFFKSDRLLSVERPSTSTMNLHFG